jgi:hypothetical protein
LFERDVGQLKITQEEIERAVRQMARHALVLMKRHYTEPRWIRLLDTAGRFVWKQLQNTDIVDIPEVTVEAGSLFRAGTAERREQIIQLLELGIIDKETAAQEIAFGTASKFILDKIQAMSHAQDMLRAVIEGGEIEMYPTDDFAAFERVFRDFMQSEEFNVLDPEAQNRIGLAYETIIQGKAIADQWRAALTAAVMPQRKPGPVPDGKVLGPPDEVAPEEVPPQTPPVDTVVQGNV